MKRFLAAACAPALLAVTPAMAKTVFQNAKDQGQRALAACRIPKLV
jgi:hypothetical protein